MLQPTAEPPPPPPKSVSPCWCLSDSCWCCWCWWRCWWSRWWSEKSGSTVATAVVFAWYIGTGRTQAHGSHCYAYCLHAYYLRPFRDTTICTFGTGETLCSRGKHLCMALGTSPCDVTEPSLRARQPVQPNPTPDRSKHKHKHNHFALACFEFHPHLFPGACLSSPLRYVGFGKQRPGSPRWKGGGGAPRTRLTHETERERRRRHASFYSKHTHTHTNNKKVQQE